MKLTTAIQSGLAAVLLTAATASHATSTDTWNFDHGAGGNGIYPSADRKYVSDNGLSVTISGWYGNDTGPGTLTNADSALRHWGGGLGIDRSGDNHTVDNSGADELIAFVFDKAVALSGVRFGWYENDSDATILYQTDKTAGFSGLGSTSIGGLTSNGYSLLGNLLNPETSSSTVQGSTSSAFSGPAQSGPVYSKVWLVGAYLQGVVGNSTSYAGAWDSIKIKTLIAHRMPSTGVSAPATLALLGLGIWAMRRQRSAA